MNADPKPTSDPIRIDEQGVVTFRRPLVRPSDRRCMVPVERWCWRSDLSSVAQCGAEGEGGNEMRIFVASLIVLAVLYFYDQGYNNGKLFDGLDSMRRSISHSMFP